MNPFADRTHFAAFLDLRGKAAVVVGGGAVGEGRAEALIRSGARVLVVAPRLTARLAQWARDGAVTVRARRFAPEDLAGAAVVVAATDDPAVNAAVAQASRALGIPVNIADDPAGSSFIVPAVVDRGPVQIAIATGGASPMLAARIAALIEKAVDPAYGPLAALAGEFRAAAKARFPGVAARREFWRRAIEGPIGRAVLEGREAEARAMLERELRP